jgi:hypothetical protein
MGDPVMNCILAVCCPPLSEQQVAALARVLTQEGVSADAAETCAKVILSKFDLAPVGTLQAFKAAIADEARGEGFLP